MYRKAGSAERWAACWEVEEDSAEAEERAKEDRAVEAPEDWVEEC